MFKIKDDLMKQIYKTPLSSCALNLLLEIIRVADEKGHAVIYYKDMADTINCSVAQFYNTLHSLKQLNFIDYIKSEEYNTEIDVYVVGNDFRTGYTNYVNTNITFIVDRQYMNFKAGEVRTYLYIVWKVAKQHDKEENKRLPHSLKALAKILGVSVRSVKKYINTLSEKSLVSYAKGKVNYYSQKKKNDVITLNDKGTKKGTVIASEKGKPTPVACPQLFGCFEHFVKAVCRRTRKTFNALSLHDTAMLFKQYSQKAKERKMDIFTLIAAAIKTANGESLNSKVTHIVLQNLLNRDYANEIILT